MLRKNLIPVFVTLVVALLSFTAVAHAAALAEPTDGSLLDLARPIYDAFLHGQYIYAGSITLVLAVALTRRFADAEWMHTDAGSAGLVLAGSFGGAMSTALAGGEMPSFAMAWTALQIAFGAAGGYAVLKAVIFLPYASKWANKGPAWLHAPMRLVLWIFQLDSVRESAPASPGSPPEQP